MLTNSDCTIYSRIYDPVNGYDVLKKQYVSKCWWFEEAKGSVTKNGLESKDRLIVRIPELFIDIKKDDIIVKGKCDVSADTIKDFAGHEFFKVTAVNYNMFGECQHIKVVAV